MTRRGGRPVGAALLALGLIVATAVQAWAQIPLLDGNPWLDRGFLNIAHRGGADEAPENTLFAYRTALDNGAHMIELDVYETADGELVAIHDATVDRTTNGSGRISDLTLSEIQALDAAYWYVNGRGAVRGEPDEAYVFRGIGTGERELPHDLEAAGFAPEDFRIPTVREVLEAFPGVWKVIELKPDTDAIGRFEASLAALLQEFERSDDVIVASFVDVHLELFKLAAPEIHTSYPLGQAAVHWASSRGPLPGLPNRHVALQVPIELEGLIEVVDEQFVADAHGMNIAVHVWTINNCETMVDLLRMGVDGIMTDKPTMLSALLAQPAGEWDCSLVTAAADAPDEAEVLGAEAEAAEADDPEAAAVRVALPETGGGNTMAGLMVAAGALVFRRALRQSRTTSGAAGRDTCR